jgi:Protein of unknown function (DUF551)
MSEWQTIDTAPTDGSEVLVIGTRHNMLVPNPRRHVAHFSRGWWSAKDVLSHVTHWMPLPQVPTTCPDCGVQHVLGARHFSGCKSHPGEPVPQSEPQSGT